MFSHAKLYARREFTIRAQCSTCQSHSIARQRIIIKAKAQRNLCTGFAQGPSIRRRIAAWTVCLTHDRGAAKHGFTSEPSHGKGRAYSRAVELCVQGPLQSSTEHRSSAVTSESHSQRPDQQPRSGLGSGVAVLGPSRTRYRSIPPSDSGLAVLPAWSAPPSTPWPALAPAAWEWGPAHCAAPEPASFRRSLCFRAELHKRVRRVVLSLTSSPRALLPNASLICPL